MQALDDAPGYRILGQAGQGGFAVVYRARQELLDRVVALKVLSVDRVDQGTMRRFQRELRLTSRLTGHPNVVTVFDTGFTRSGRPYIAMDFFEAGSLRERLDREGPLPVADVLRIGVKMAGALAAVHAAGVLHGDLKPQNILVSRYGEPALADFGIARVVDSAEVSALGQAFTPMHAAPEILNGKPHSAASDIYSLGSTLYHLLAGLPAFYDPADTAVAPLILRVLSHDPPPVARPNVPAALTQAIVQAMAKRPEDRYASAAHLAARFQHVQRELGLPVTDLVGGTAYFTGAQPQPGESSHPTPPEGPTNAPAHPTGALPHPPGDQAQPSHPTNGPAQPSHFTNGPAQPPHPSRDPAQPSHPTGGPAQPSHLAGDLGQPSHPTSDPVPPAASTSAPARGLRGTGPMAPQSGPDGSQPLTAPPFPPFPHSASSPASASQPAGGPTPHPATAPVQRPPSPAPANAPTPVPAPAAPSDPAGSSQAPGGSSRQGASFRSVRLVTVAGLAVAAIVVAAVAGAAFLWDRSGAPARPTGTVPQAGGTPSGPVKPSSPGVTSPGKPTPDTTAAIDDSVLASLRPRRLSVADDAGKQVTLRWTLPGRARRYPLVLQQEPVVTNALTPLERAATSTRVFDLDPEQGYCFRVGVALSIGSSSKVAWSAPLCIRDAVATAQGGAPSATAGP
ncbi:serine/threonine-protein kinase [Sphaerisporangium fuscum]|uniref:serine/threonine-protein kinase n=1 Tax=Sphaerisporangium fuscum TaxID=2835868 RepID=UPI001BDD712D|nr:serine/threonine-protein kinase [Sphaerisporangium fuscum]